MGKVTTWNGSSGDWSASGNWTNGVPVSTDDVYFENNSQSVTTGFPSGTVNLASLNIDQSYTGSLATAATGPLSLGITALNIGYHNGPGTPAGSPSIYLNLGSATASTITVSNTGTSADASRAPVRLYGSNAGNTMTVIKGKVEFGTNVTDTTSVLDKLTVLYDTKVATDADVFIGSGVHLDEVDMHGGDVFIEMKDSEPLDLATVRAGILTTSGNGDLTTLTVHGGTVYCSHGEPSSGTEPSVGTLNVYGGSGTVDFTKSQTARNVTHMNLDPGGTIKYNDSVVTVDTTQINPYTSGINVTYTAS